MFFIYKTRQEKGCRRAGKRSEGTKKEGVRVRFLRTHNGERVKGQGALMCGKGGSQEFSDHERRLVRAILHGESVWIPFHGHMSGWGFNSRNIIRWPSALPAVHNGGGFAVPAMGSQRRGVAKAAACNGAAAYRGIGIRKSARTHLGDFAAATNRGGLGTWERSGRGIRRGKREEGSVGREMCVSQKTINESKI